MRVAFVGLGRMGTAMARNLVAAGHEVTVWNRTAAKTRDVEGARAASTPADAAAGAEAVLTMLADDAAVRGVVLGDEGVAAGLASDAVHVSMSTISVELARTLTSAHEKRGQAFVSAPVFGRPEAAEGRKLRIVAAGPAQAVERCRPLFDAMGQQTFHVGDRPEAANVVKLAGNFTIAALIETLGEAFAFARKGGVEADALLEVFDQTLLNGPIFPGYAKMVAAAKYEPAGFKLRLGLKDVRLVLAAADDAQVPMPFAGVMHDRLLSGVARGKGDIDWSGAAGLVAEAAGLED